MKDDSKENMTIKTRVKKIIFITWWTLFTAGVIVLSIAALDAKSNKTCQGYEIDIHGAKNGHLFIDKKDIILLLTKNQTQKIKGKPLSAFQLRNIEETLEKNVWVKDAELFFDNNHILRVRINERTPVARLFTSTGNTFYIDSSCKRLPLSDEFSARVPVFTRFPSDRVRLNRVDSMLMRQIAKVGSYILDDPFLMAQVAQVEITHTRTFEMIPTIGNHLIVFGDGTDHEKKFRRLKIFYRNVLSKVGLDKYSKINVQYDQQVIGEVSGER